MQCITKSTHNTYITIKLYGKHCKHILIYYGGHLKFTDLNVLLFIRLYGKHCKLKHFNLLRRTLEVHTLKCIIIKLYGKHCKLKHFNLYGGQKPDIGSLHT